MMTVGIASARQPGSLRAPHRPAGASANIRCPDKRIRDAGSLPAPRCLRLTPAIRS